MNGSFAATTLGFDGTRHFTEFAEEGRVETSYTARRGAGLETALRYGGRHWGLAVAAGLLLRRTSAEYAAFLPHPLYLDRFREVHAGTSGLSQGEVAGHLAAVYIARRGALEVSLFGGPSVFRVKADLVEPPRYTHSYPYDTVAVTSVPTLSARTTALGFHAGAGLDGRVSDRLAVGAQVRFARAPARLAAGERDTVTVQAGGLQLLAGLRFRP